MGTRNKSYMSVIGIITTLLLTVIPSSVNAQDTWVKEYDPFNILHSSFEIYNISNLITFDNGYLITGFFEYIDSVTVSGWGFVMSIDKSGSINWIRQDNLDTGIKTSGITSDGGILCSGWERFTENRYLLKRDSQGHFRWMKPHVDFCPFTMINTEDGDIILGGKSIDFNSIKIKKLNGDGDVLWEKEISFNENSKVNLLSSITTSDKQYIFCGWIDIHGDGNKNTFIISLDPDGNVLWTRTNKSFAGEDRGVAIAQSSTGKILVVGIAKNQDRRLGLFWLLDSNGVTVKLNIEGGKYAQACGTVAALPNGEFICGSPSIMKINENFEILWEQNYLCGGGEKKICLTDDGGFIFPSRYKNSFILTKTDSTGIVHNGNPEITQ